MKIHKNYYACFDCRKVFVHQAYWETTEIHYTDHRGRKKTRNAYKPRAKATCSECGGTLYVMGRRFKAPKRNDKKAWQKVERLRLNGVRFGYGRLPRKGWEVDEYLEMRDRHRLKSDGERLLDKINRHSNE